jgi:NAD(P)-dependent dehydrogenase (short-subunit alcohol dehydrogenase family)
MKEGMKNLEAQKVVVLGGTSGIGRAVAKAARESGAAVVVASSSAEKVEAARRDLGVEGRVVDLTDEQAMAALFEAVGPFDHLVYTAGDSLVLGPLATLDAATARRAFDLRFFGALLAAKLAAPRLRRGGSIVLTHGIAGVRPRAGWSVGASICGAMESLTRALAVELAPLRVNAVSPGFVRTPLWSSLPEADREALYRDAGAKLPVGRVGEPEDLAEAYLYLMKSAFSTGQTVIVDGGGVLG